MNKTLIILSLLGTALIVGVAVLYNIPVHDEHISYLNYKEEFAYSLKNPLIERYRKQAMQPALEAAEVELDQPTPISAIEDDPTSEK